MPDLALDAFIARRAQLALVGLPGAGKTSMGRKLAALTGIAFHDCDELLEAQAGRSIAEMFADFGEAEFRRLERRAVNSLVDGRPKIIALGGGAFEEPATRSLLLEHALVVWADCPDVHILARLAGSTTRPLLAGGERAEQLAALRAARSANYANAHVRVDASDTTAAAAWLAARWRPAEAAAAGRVSLT